MIVAILCIEALCRNHFATGDKVSKNATISRQSASTRKRLENPGNAPGHTYNYFDKHI